MVDAVAALNVAATSRPSVPRHRSAEPGVLPATNAREQRRSDATVIGAGDVDRPNNSKHIT
jgi:hypothetical protein